MYRARDPYSVVPLLLRRERAIEQAKKTAPAAADSSSIRRRRAGEDEAPQQQRRRNKQGEKAAAAAAAASKGEKEPRLSPEALFARWRAELRHLDVLGESQLHVEALARAHSSSAAASTAQQQRQRKAQHSAVADVGVDAPSMATTAVVDAAVGTSEGESSLSSSTATSDLIEDDDDEEEEVPAMGVAERIAMIVQADLSSSDESSPPSPPPPHRRKERRKKEMSPTPHIVCDAAVPIPAANSRTSSLQNQKPATPSPPPPPPSSSSPVPPPPPPPQPSSSPVPLPPPPISPPSESPIPPPPPSPKQAPSQSPTPPQQQLPTTATAQRRPLQPLVRVDSPIDHVQPRASPSPPVDSPSQEKKRRLPSSAVRVLPPLSVAPKQRASPLAAIKPLELPHSPSPSLSPLSQKSPTSSRVPVPPLRLPLSPEPSAPQKAVEAPKLEVMPQVAAAAGLEQQDDYLGSSLADSPILLSESDPDSEEEGRREDLIPAHSDSISVESAASSAQALLRSRSLGSAFSLVLRASRATEKATGLRADVARDATHEAVWELRDRRESVTADAVSRAVLQWCASSVPSDITKLVVAEQKRGYARLGKRAEAEQDAVVSQIADALLNEMLSEEAARLLKDR